MDELIQRQVRERQDVTAEFEVVTRHGERRVLEVSTRLIQRDGTPVEIQGIARDVTERKEQEQALRSLTIIDDLTKLYNRRGFLTLAERHLKLAVRKKTGVFLLFADLDGLKVINDTFGHLEGDRALVDAADILRASFRSADIIARLGGDEFTVFPIEAAAESGADADRRGSTSSCDAHNETQPVARLSSGAQRRHRRASSPTARWTIDQLLDHADQRAVSAEARAPSLARARLQPRRLSAPAAPHPHHVLEFRRAARRASAGECRPRAPGGRHRGLVAVIGLVLSLFRDPGLPAYVSGQLHARRRRPGHSRPRSRPTRRGSAAALSTAPPGAVRVPALDALGYTLEGGTHVTLGGMPAALAIYHNTLARAARLARRDRFGRRRCRRRRTSARRDGRSVTSSTTRAARDRLLAGRPDPGGRDRQRCRPNRWCRSRWPRPVLRNPDTIRRASRPA